ncbi:MAG: D-alanyl-D-alanine carboxypeptidase family protein [Tissierellia bacterium]|nr:D-alanyl-D-alanine carboxypeptidase family protein [Tissierellia bacterium]
MKSRKIALALVLLFVFFSLQAPVFAENPPSPEEKKEVRDQDIIVPTPKGPQRATKEEADHIAQVQEKTNDQLLGAYLIGDFDTGKILQAKDIDRPVALASVTKLMTVYLALDAIDQGEISLDTQVTIDSEASSKIGSTYKLKEGDVVTVDQLIRAGLVVSGNDAMVALAKTLAGSEEAFVARMNAKAQALGLSQAHFINVHGLTNYEEEEPKYNQMTVRELFALSINLIKDHPQVLDITQTPYIKEESRNFLAYNTNPLLGIVPGVNGLKTGYTGAAGRCLVATGWTPESQDHLEGHLIGIFMGAQSDWDRFVASQRMMTEALDRYQVLKLVKEDQPLAQLAFKDGLPSQVQAYPQKTGGALVDRQSLLEETLILEGHPPKSQILDPKEARPSLEGQDPLPMDLPLPLKAGDRVGKVQYRVDDELIYEADLILQEEVREPNPIRHLQYAIKSAFQAIDALVA